MENLIVLSSPSGGGKTTIAKYIMSLYPHIHFSVSATTRIPREGEINGKDYFFLSKADFLDKIEKNELIEYEEIFGNIYGTLKSEADKAISNGSTIIFDVDVKGAMSIKKIYPENSLLIFVSPPNIEVLEERLRGRKTESEEQIQKRLQRAEMELTFADKFDLIIINDRLEDALKKTQDFFSNYFNS